MPRLNLLSAALTACLALTAATAPAQATVRIHIDLATQRMHVDSSSGSWNWPVSTARDGYVTPPGEFEPTGMERMHYSQKYDNAPMPYSIFFYGGYAIHGSYATGSLGRVLADVRGALGEVLVQLLGAFLEFPNFFVDASFHN